MPIVTTRVAGIPSLVEHEVNGWLVDEPAAGAVADAIARIIADAPLRRRLIANGYETARRFTLEAQAARMLTRSSARLRRHVEAAGDGAGRVSRMVSGRRKICFVLPSLAGGGAERAAVQILNALDPAGLGSLDVPVHEGRARISPMCRRRSGFTPATQRVAGRAVARAAAVRARDAARDRRVVPELLHGADARSRGRACRCARGLQSADPDVGVSRGRRLSLAAPLASARCSRSPRAPAMRRPI